MLDIPICPEKMRVFVECAGREPAVHFECDENQIPAIKDGYCDKEQADFIACAKMSGTAD